MKYILALMLLSGLTTGCGVSMEDPTAKRFVGAKDELYDKKGELGQKNSELKDTQDFLRNAYVKDGKIWIWPTTNSSRTFEEAQAECENLKFALPTRAEAEAALADPTLAEVILIDKDVPNSIMVYLKDEPDQTNRIGLVCLR